MEKRKVLVIFACCILLILVIALITLIILYQHSTNGSSDAYTSSISALTFFGKSDGLDLVWYHRANSRATLDQALEGPYQMIEADVQYENFGLENQTNRIVMVHAPNITSDLTLHEFIDRSINNKEPKGLKLDFKGTEVVADALTILKNFGRIEVPIWLNADVINGPNAGDNGRDAGVFLYDVDENYPDATLSVGWTTGGEGGELYTERMVEEMWWFVRQQKQPFTFPLRVKYLYDSWDNLRTLLNKNWDRLSMTLWTVAGTSWESADPYELLLVRNDIPKTLIYYDLEEIDKMILFRRLCVTAGNPMNHFFNSSDVRWDGAWINWKDFIPNQQWTQSLSTDKSVGMRRVQVSSDQSSSELVISNSPSVTLAEWLDAVIDTSNGIHIMLNNGENLTDVLLMLELRKSLFKQPVFIGARFVKGPNSDLATFEPVNWEAFIGNVKDIYPEVNLCLGWLYGQSVGQFTQAMIDEMLDYAEDTQLPVTFEVPAQYAIESWELFQGLLSKSRRYTALINDDEGILTIEDLFYIRQNSATDKIFYLIKNQSTREQFITDISNSFKPII